MHFHPYYSEGNDFKLRGVMVDAKLTMTSEIDKIVHKAQAVYVVIVKVEMHIVVDHDHGQQYIFGYRWIEKRCLFIWQLHINSIAIQMMTYGSSCNPLK